MNNYEKQHQIETMGYSKACAVKREQQAQHVKNGSEYNLSYGQEIIKELLPVAEQYTRELYTKRNQHTKPFFWELVKPRHLQHLADKEAKVSKWKMTPEPAVQLSEIASVLLVAKLSKGITLKNIAETITRSALKMFNIPFVEWDEWLDCGVSYFSMMVMDISEKTDIFDVKSIDKREHRLILSSEWEDKVEEIQDKFGLNVSKYTPMIVPPTPHKDLISGDGGYLHTVSPLLKYPMKLGKDIHPMLKNFTAETCPSWFEKINKAQSTPYVINTRLFSLILDYYDMGYFFNKFPIEKNLADANEAALKEITTRNEKRKKYAEKNNEEYTPLLKTTMDKIYRTHQSNASEQVRKTNALFEQATNYSVEKAIYFPIFVDYRGRRYPYANTSLSFQGDEMAKALLQFANKKELGLEGEQVMFETLGNTLGKDKVVNSVKEQFAREWFASHKPLFDAGDFSIFFTNQDEFEEPINAMAICVELVEYFKDPSYKTGYIAHRDARCSGASIIGTILRDKNIMEMTSVLDWADEEDKLGDAYMASANKAKLACQFLADNGNKICQDLIELENKLFTRSVFKKVVMVNSSYGGTEYGMREHNKAIIDWEEEGLSKEHKSAFDSIMTKALDAALPSCSKYLAASREAARKVVDRDGYVTFVNPVNNFPVVNKEYKSEKRTISVVNNLQRIRLTLITPTTKADNVGMVNSSAPGIVHSLDAALLNLVEEQVDFDLSLIHDSLGSHPADTKDVVLAYSRAMKVYSENNLFNYVFESMNVDTRVEEVNTFTGEMEISAHCIV